MYFRKGKIQGVFVKKLIVDKILTKGFWIESGNKEGLLDIKIRMLEELKNYEKNRGIVTAAGVLKSRNEEIQIDKKADLGKFSHSANRSKNISRICPIENS